MSLPFNTKLAAVMLQARELSAPFGLRYQTDVHAPFLLQAIYECNNTPASHILRRMIYPSSFTRALQKVWGISDPPTRGMLPIVSTEHAISSATIKARHASCNEVTVEDVLLELTSDFSEFFRCAWSLEKKTPSVEKSILLAKLTKLAYWPTPEAKPDPSIGVPGTAPAAGSKAIALTNQPPAPVNNQRAGTWIPRDLEESSVLRQYGVDITVKAKAGKLDPIRGRAEEIDRALRILGRLTKKNPLIVGEAGVGKTTIVEGMAMRIVSGQVRAQLRHKRIFSISLADLVAGTRYRGDFEQRFQKLLAEASEHGDILFLDEIHTLVGSGASESGIDGGNMIKPKLANGDIAVIGATTLNEYRKTICKDPALERRFKTVLAEAPNAQEAIAMLEGKRHVYEDNHQVRITDQALKAAVDLSVRYVQGNLPDMAFDLLDEACSAANDALPGSDLPCIDSEDIAAIVSQSTGIPVASITEGERAKLLKLEEHLRRRVIGQEEALQAVAKAIRRSRADLGDDSGTVANLLLLGPTGTGKTELAKAIGEQLFDNDEIVRFDMSEFSEKHTVSRLIGSPPGYVGFDEAGQLTEAIRRKPYSILLFDELEKAHTDVLNILLQVMEDGRLTDGHGITVDFSHCLLICTSNIGVDAMSQGALGFGKGDASETSGIPDRVMKEIKKRLRPEFINRFTEMIKFNSLTPEVLRQIVDINLDKLIAKLASKEIKLEVTDAAKDLLAKRGYDKEYGARPLKRTVIKLVKDPIAEMLLSETIGTGSSIQIDANGEGLSFQSIPLKILEGA